MNAMKNPNTQTPCHQQRGISMGEFAAFYYRIMERHCWGVPGLTFCPKYIDSVVDTRDGQIWSITLRDVITDESVLKRIPSAWKHTENGVTRIVLQDRMGDGYHGLAERLERLLQITEGKDK